MTDERSPSAGTVSTRRLAIALDLARFAIITSICDACANQRRALIGHVTRRMSDVSPRGDVVVAARKSTRIAARHRVMHQANSSLFSVR